MEARPYPAWPEEVRRRRFAQEFVLRLRRLATNRWVIQIVIVAVLLAVALFRLDFKALAQAFADVHYAWLVFALVVYIGSRLVHAVEWQITLTKVGRAPFFGLFGVLLIGTLVNAVVPASAGDVVKIQFVANRYGLPRAGLVAGRGAEALVNAVLIVVFVVISFALPQVGFASRDLLWLLAGGMLVAMSLAVFAARTLPVEAPDWRILLRLPGRLQAGNRRHWPRIYEGFEVLRRPRLLAIALAFNLFGWIVDIAISWAFGRAFNLQLPLAAFVSVTVVIGIITIFPITFGNVGTFELAVISALSLYGISGHDAVAYAVGVHVFSTLFNIGLGVIAMLVMGMRPGEVFRLRGPKTVAPTAKPP